MAGTTNQPSWMGLLYQVIFVTLISAFTAYISQVVIISELKINMENLTKVVATFSTRLQDHEVIQYRMTQVERDLGSLKTTEVSINSIVNELKSIMEQKTLDCSIKNRGH